LKKALKAPAKAGAFFIFCGFGAKNSETHCKIKQKITLGGIYMTQQKVLERAQQLRPNMIPEDIMAGQLHVLEAQIAEMMGVPVPADSWPQDRDMLLDDEHADVYVFYLMAVSDELNEEAALYENDRAIFNSRMAEVKAWWRRNNAPERNHAWKVGVR
jgi:hypothetical protein